MKKAKLFDCADLLCWQHDMGFSQIEAAAALNTAIRTYQRWVWNETPIPPIVKLACIGVTYAHALAAGARPLDFPSAKKNPPDGG